MIAKSRGIYDIGTSIIKRFNGIPYNDNVISNNGCWYRIKYEDDDREELTNQEMAKLVQQANKILFANAWHKVYLRLAHQEHDKSQEGFDVIRDFENET